MNVHAVKRHGGIRKKTAEEHEKRMGNANLGINYTATQNATDQISQVAEVSLKDTVDAAYLEMHALLALSAGDAVDKLKEHLLKDQELATKVADVYQQLAALVQKATDEFEKLDNKKSTSQVSINSHHQVKGGLK